MAIALIGDIILDHYITGSTSRISPEAPVPIVQTNEEKFTLGGVANLANNLVGLENKVTLFGAVGQDVEADILTNLCTTKEIDHFLFKSYEICTTKKTRIISRNQQMLRIDKEDFFKHNVGSLSFLDNIQKYEIIAISDYNKGFCSKPMFEKLFQNISSSTRVLIDPKGLDWQKYNGAFLVKPNLAELGDILGRPIKNNDEDVELYGKQIFDQFDFQHLVITRGHKGMTLINKQETKHFSASEVAVYDVSGAGDTALAVIVHALAHNYALDQCIKLANLASSYVVSKPMTYAISKMEFEELI
jgi:rfaE bifunctional protein kinase chain/domain